MPEAPGLLGALGPVAALLAPVVLLLFAALRLRRRVRYPHGLLSARDSARRSTAFLRAIRVYYDAALDAACAVLVGLAVSGYPRAAPHRGRAVVVDASLSMLAGLRGDRPLDEATRLALSDERLAGARFFALGWDPRTREPRLEDYSEAFSSAESPQRLAIGLESSEAFFSADYGLVPELSRRGFGELVLITDEAGLEGRGVEILRVAAKPARYVLSAAAAWDDERGRSVVRFVEAGGAGLEALWRVADDGSLTRAKPEDYAVVPSPSGFELSFPEAGLWAAQWDGHFLPFEAPGRPEPLRAEGRYAGRVVAALGSIGAPGADPRRGGRGLVVRDGGGAGVPGFVAVSRAGSEPAVLPPRLTLGAVVAAGIDDRADLSLGRAAEASPETATAFWVARAAGGSGTEAPRRGRAEPIRVGDGFLYPARGEGRPELVAPPPEEYAPSDRRILVTAGRPPDRRLVVALLLATLYGLKLTLRRLLRRGSIA